MSIKKIIKELNEIVKEIQPQEEEKVSDYVKELLRPENLSGPYHTVDELMKNTWDSED